MNESLKLGVTVDDAGEYAGFYLPEEDRSTHMYVLGSSGVGKSKGLANWILEDINNGRGCGVIDPHGDLVNDIVETSMIFTMYAFSTKPSPASPGSWSRHGEIISSGLTKTANHGLHNSK
ncbi:MAG: hypothetical protein ACYC57_08215 [Thermoleophilia bacterium]